MSQTFVNLVIFLCGVGVGVIFNEYASYMRQR